MTLKPLGDHILETGIHGDDLRNVQQYIRAEDSSGPSLDDYLTHAIPRHRYRDGYNGPIHIRQAGTHCTSAECSHESHLIAVDTKWPLFLRVRPFWESRTPGSHPDIRDVHCPLRLELGSDVEYSLVGRVLYEGNPGGIGHFTAEVRIGDHTYLYDDIKRGGKLTEIGPLYRLEQPHAGSVDGYLLYVRSSTASVSTINLCYFSYAFSQLQSADNASSLMQKTTRDITDIRADYERITLAAKDSPGSTLKNAIDVADATPWDFEVNLHNTQSDQPNQLVSQESPTGSPHSSNAGHAVADIDVDDMLVEELPAFGDVPPAIPDWLYNTPSPTLPGTPGDLPIAPPRTPQPTTNSIDSAPPPSPFPVHCYQCGARGDGYLDQDQDQVQCSQCEKWSHRKCIGVDTDWGDSNQIFVCIGCQIKPPVPVSMYVVKFLSCV